MFINLKSRNKLLIANSKKELVEFAKKVDYPVLLTPFGLSEEYLLSTPSTDRERRVRNEYELLKIADEVLQEGVFGLVHVFKIHENQCY